MTFTEIVSMVVAQLDRRASDSTTRIGTRVNLRYKQVCSAINVRVAQPVIGLAGATTQGVQTVTFTGVEKIDRVIDDTSGSVRVLDEVTLDEIRRETPAATDTATRWAVQSVAAGAVTIRLDVLPQTVFNLKADGRETAETLSGVLEPQFAASFHDILVEGVLADELAKDEKPALADRHERKFEKRLSELRMDVARTGAKVRQGGSAAAASSGAGSGGGSGVSGGTSYTQSGQVTFDRGAGVAPFAVAQADAPYVPNLGAEFLGNIATDRLIGRDTAGTGESEQLTVGGGIEFTGAGGIRTTAFTGDVTKSAGGTALTIAASAVETAMIEDLAVTTAKVANDNITYAKIQNVTAASRLLGRGSAAGSGDVEELTAGTGLEILSTVLNVVLPGVCQGRLTLTSGTAVTTSDVTGATTIYFTPYKGNKVSLFDGTNWALYTFTERSLALGTLTSGLPYDVFLYNNAGTLTLELTAWTNDTTRATALASQDGVLVKTGALTRRYLGTLRTTSTTATEDSLANRYVWNYYNRVARPLRRLETGSWTYTTATIRQANGSTANQVGVLIGVAGESRLRLSLQVVSANTNADILRTAGIGEDSTSSFMAQQVLSSNPGGAIAANHPFTTVATLTHYPTVGRHFYSWNEISLATGTTTWYGAVALTGANALQSGLHGEIEG